MTWVNVYSGGNGIDWITAQHAQDNKATLSGTKFIRVEARIRGVWWRPFMAGRKPK